MATKELNEFQKVILEYLENRAKTDKLFAETFKKEGKNIQDCETYILNQVKQSGRSGFADEEIFGMAVHYYDEDEINVGKSVNASIIINKPLQEEKTELPKPKKVKEVKPKDKDNYPHEQLLMF